MTSPTEPLQPAGADDPATVLAHARARKQDEDQAGRDVMVAAAAWAGMHSLDSLVGPLDQWHEQWHEQALPLGGEGCPEVAEFAVLEFGAALGKSTPAGRHYLAQAIEGHYRLIECWNDWSRGCCQRGSWGSSPTAPSPCHQRRHGSWTGTSHPWPTPSAPRS
jgi:hypothetical protein